MTIRAIPTRYAGRQFRSRLEARWATFFDLVGWRWEYEPFDLRGWIPDFALIGAHQTSLVEVKPVADFGEEACRQARKKAVRAVLASERKSEILILGYSWPTARTGDTSIGWLNEWIVHGHEYPPLLNWKAAPFHSLGSLGFHHEEFSYRNWISGQYDGTSGTFAPAPLDLWTEAGNLTQWRAVS